MKKFNHILLIAIAISVFFSACKKDEADLIGTYKVTKFSELTCTNATDNFTYDFSANNGCVEEGGITYCDTYTLTFKTGGVVTTNYVSLEDGVELFNIDLDATYTVSGNDITICGDNCFEGTFTLSDSGLLSISGSNSETGCDVSYEAQRQ
jgi:hypothetical protein